jgi:hypothetical protein
MNAIRQAIADALGIPATKLGCFTLTDHDDQPAIVIIHGGEYQGVWVEVGPFPAPEGKTFMHMAKV